MTTAIVLRDDALRDATRVLLAEAGIAAAGFGSCDCWMQAEMSRFSCVVTSAGSLARRDVAAFAAAARLPCLLLVPEPVETAVALGALAAGVAETIELPVQAERLPDAVRSLTSVAAGRAPPLVAVTASRPPPLETLFLWHSLAGWDLPAIKGHMKLDSPRLLALRRSAIAATGAHGLLGALRAAQAMGLRPACRPADQRCGD